MRTTELTAVSILKGEIIVQMGEYLSQSVAFQSVRNHVRGELQTAADDPDLAEVFELLISLGVGRDSHVQHLQDWTTAMETTACRTTPIVFIMCAASFVKTMSTVSMAATLASIRSLHKTS